MPNYLKFIVGSILTLLITISLNSYLFIEIEEMHKITRLYNSNNADEIILLGSSRCHGSLIPSLISDEKQVYNYGVSGSGNKLWLAELRDLVDDSNSQTIIVNVDRTSTFSLDGGDGNFRYYLNTPRKTTVYELLSNETKDQLSPFPFYWFGQLAEFIRLYIRERINTTGYTEKGCRIQLNYLSPEQFERGAKPYLGKSEMSTDFARILTEITNRNQKDRIIFISLPVFGAPVEIKPSYEEIQRIIGEGAYYLPFDMVISEREDFFDKNHPSLTGAQKISRALSYELKKLTSAVTSSVE